LALTPYFLSHRALTDKLFTILYAVKQEEEKKGSMMCMCLLVLYQRSLITRLSSFWENPIPHLSLPL